MDNPMNLALGMCSQTPVTSDTSAVTSNSALQLMAPQVTSEPTGSQASSQAVVPKKVHASKQRKLITWTNEKNEHLIIALDHVAKSHGLRIPMHEVAKCIHADATAGAVEQHIAKIRAVRLQQGLPTHMATKSRRKPIEPRAASPSRVTKRARSRRQKRRSPVFDGPDPDAASDPDAEFGAPVQKGKNMKKGHGKRQKPREPTPLSEEERSDTDENIQTYEESSEENEGVPPGAYVFNAGMVAPTYAPYDMQAGGSTGFPSGFGPIHPNPNFANIGHPAHVEWTHAPMTWSPNSYLPRMYAPMDYQMPQMTSYDVPQTPGYAPIYTSEPPSATSSWHSFASTQDDSTFGVELPILPAQPATHDMEANNNVKEEHEPMDGYELAYDNGMQLATVQDFESY